MANNVFKAFRELDKTRPNLPLLTKDMKDLRDRLNACASVVTRCPTCKEMTQTRYIPHDAVESVPCNFCSYCLGRIK